MCDIEERQKRVVVKNTRFCFFVQKIVESRCLREIKKDYHAEKR